MSRMIIAVLAAGVGLSGCNEGGGSASGGAIVMIRDAAVGKPYQSAGPRSCGDRKVPNEGPLSKEQARDYVICGREKESGNTLELVGGITIDEISPGRPYSDRQDNNMPDVDVTKPIQSIRGKMLAYTCWQVMTGGDYISRHRTGTNCHAHDHPNATGLCYRNMMGQWSCSFSDYNARHNFKEDLPPPA